MATGSRGEAARKNVAETAILELKAAQVQRRCGRCFQTGVLDLNVGNHAWVVRYSSVVTPRVVIGVVKERAVLPIVRSHGSSSALFETGSLLRCLRGY